MHTDLNAILTDTGTRYFGPARVLGQTEKARTLRILLGDLSAESEADARIPVSLPVDPDPGDLVLVAGESGGGFYILAVLERGFTDTAPVRNLDSPEGAAVTLEEGPLSSSIKVFSRRQELLFEYEPATEKMKLHMAPGDLELDVPGNIRFRAGGVVELAGRAVKVRASSDVKNGTGEPGSTLASESSKVGANETSSLDLRPGEIGLETTRLGVLASRGNLRVDHLKFIGSRLDAVVKRSRLFIERAERISKTVIEKTGNAYHTVEQLTQLRTGRMRTLVDSTYHMKARKAYLKSEQDFNVDGKRINLG